MTQPRDSWPSSTPVVKTGCGNLYIHIVEDGKGNTERIMTDLGKSGTCAKCLLSVISALLKPILNQMPRQDAINALNEAIGHNCGWGKLTCTDLFLREVMQIKLNEKPTDGKVINGKRG